MSFGCASKSAIFLDRDGTINRLKPGGYVTSRADFEFLPGALDALAFLAQNSGRKIVIVTNQPAIGRGLATSQEIYDLQLWMRLRIFGHGGRIEGVYVCPHTPEDKCHCRKPQPGLLFQAVRDLDLDLQKSVLVGDARSDIQAARTAGIPEIYYVMTGDGQAPLPEDRPDLDIMADLGAAAKLIVSREKGNKQQ